MTGSATSATKKRPATEGAHRTKPPPGAVHVVGTCVRRGILFNDPALRRHPDGTAIVEFSFHALWDPPRDGLLVVEEAEVTVLGAVAEHVAAALRSGDHVLVVGTEQLRWVNEGAGFYARRVFADDVYVSLTDFAITVERVSSEVAAAA